ATPNYIDFDMNDRTTDPAATEETLSIDGARLVNDACERFEGAWRSDGRPRIEDAMAGAGAGRRLLLRELLALELELRREGGEHPEEAEYRARFPGDPDVVEEAFRGSEPEVIAG